MNDSPKPIVGVVGVGRMGASVALHLHDLGYTIAAVFDERERLQHEVAAALGAEPSPALSRVTQLCDVIITVVSDDAAMDQVFSTVDDSLLIEARGKTFINCATVTPAVHVEIERRCEAAGAAAIEACMASSIPQAREGRLYLMVGGRAEAVDRVRPLLEDLSEQLRYIGGAGEAAKVKALVNMVMNSNTVALAEGLGLGEALGLDLDVLREVFGQTGAASRVLQTDGEDMQNREHEVYFSAAHAAKDSNIAIALAAQRGLDLPVAAAAAKQFERMKALGLGELDKSGVAELTFLSRRAREGANA
jgi:3-hydroxyisobutyrate dehydrogenase